MRINKRFFKKDRFYKFTCIVETNDKKYYGRLEMDFDSFSYASDFTIKLNGN